MADAAEEVARVEDEVARVHDPGKVLGRVVADEHGLAIAIQDLVQGDASTAHRHPTVVVGLGR